VLLPHEGVRHSEQTRDNFQRLACEFGCLKRSVGRNPGGVRLVLPREACCGYLVRPGPQRVQFCPLTCRRMSNCRFDAREQLGEVIAERCVAGCVRESPCLFDMLAEVGERWSWIGWRLLKEAAQGGVAGEGYA
jgi:hypothetical protein